VIRISGTAHNKGSVKSIILGKGVRIEDGQFWDELNSYGDRNDAMVQFGTMVVAVGVGLMGNHFLLPNSIHLHVHISLLVHKLCYPKDNPCCMPSSIYANVHLLQHVHMSFCPMDNHLSEPIAIQ
jgi:hypothetical protein